jgi:serine/threonine protein kinase
MTPSANTLPRPTETPLPAPSDLAAFGDAVASLGHILEHHWTEPSRSELIVPGLEIGPLLGTGGMGSVYEARQINLNRTVAIKILPPELSVDQEFVARFHREACALARLSHPHIVAVHDHGETTEGDAYIIMEKLEGQTLGQKLADGPLPVSEAYRIGKEIGLALSFAHSKDVLHRDIKASNIFVSPEGWVTLLDFGLASNFQGKNDPPTRIGSRICTPEYAAPELRTGKGPIDSRVDVFSLGVLCYEMLSGVLPRGKLLSLTKTAKISRSCEKLIFSAIESDPNKRPSTMAAFVQAYCEAERQHDRNRWNRRYWCIGVILGIFLVIALWALLS